VTQGGTVEVEDATYKTVCLCLAPQLTLFHLLQHRCSWIADMNAQYAARSTVGKDHWPGMFGWNAARSRSCNAHGAGESAREMTR